MAKPTIVTRAGKGSALTWTEGDANLTNLRDATITVTDGTNSKAIDLNGTLTFSNGTNTTVAVNATTGAVTVSASGGVTINNTPANSNHRVVITTATSGSQGTLYVPSSGNSDLIYDPVNNTLEATTLIASSSRLDSVGSKTEPASGVRASIDFLSGNALRIRPGYNNGTGLATGSVKLGMAELLFPNTDGTANQVLKTDGSGQLSWTTVSSGTTLPSQTGNNGKYLTTDGSALSWATVSGGASTLDGLTDVVITAAATNDALIYNGTDWVDTALSGVTVGTASVGSTVTLTNDESTNLANYLLFANATTGNLSPRTDSALTYNPLTGIVATTGKFVKTGGASSANPWATGAAFVTATGTYTDTTTTGTLGTGYINMFNTPTYTATNALTITQAANLWVAAPVASTNVTFTNAWSIQAGGRIKALALDDTPVGSTTPSSGSFTTLTSNNSGPFRSSMSSSVIQLGANTPDATNPKILLAVGSGAMDGVVIGGTVPLAGTFTTMTADVAILKDIRETVAATGVSSGTFLPVPSNGSIQTMTLTGNITINAFMAGVSGNTVTLIITQDATGGRTLTSTMKFAGGSKTLSTAANAVDILTISLIGATYYASLGKGFA